jgi:hypothetical protein
MLSKALLGSAAAAVPAYIEDVFSTYLYTGNGSTQTITNGIDLSGKGGLVWCKQRDGSALHLLYDTNRGAGYRISSDLTDAQVYDATTRLTSFTSSGFTLGNLSPNTNGATFASWTFREQAKFFDVVTYTGNGANNRQISHNLGSAPGCIILKRTDGTGEWWTYHRSLGDVGGFSYDLQLNTTSNKTAYQIFGTGATQTSTYFTLGTVFAAEMNGNGANYVAYLFAHNAGGFGLTGTDNVISCGSFTADYPTGTDVNLGYEPQFVMMKSATSASQWYMIDNMRGWVNGANDLYVSASSAGADSAGDYGYPTATGFRAVGPTSSGETIIYIAIRRGPMKTPTTGTSVFNLASATEPDTTPLFSPGTPPPDLIWHKPRININPHEFYFADRLRGNNVILASNAQDAERSATASLVPPWKFNSGQKAQLDAGVYFNNSGGAGQPYALYSLIRAPGFFDEVCYTGTGVAGLTITHNLGVVPELIIVKGRNYTVDFAAYSATLGNTKYLLPNTTAAEATSSLFWNSTSPTTTTFTLGTSGRTNNTASNTYVAYLFATCAGVSKVGSYTGTGALQTVNCGFAAGARFVLIKRTDSTGDWYIWDSARGISSGNDPYILMNSTAIEVTGTNYVDTTAVGFQVTAAAPAAINANGGTFIFLAVA